MVGRAMAIDLAKQYHVTSFDVSGQSLQILSEKNNAIKTIRADLSDHSNYGTLLAGFDFIISAVPGFMGYKTLEAVILAKKNMVDISFGERVNRGLAQRNPTNGSGDQTRAPQVDGHPALSLVGPGTGGVRNA